jgi:hypothetical protein
MAGAIIRTAFNAHQTGSPFGRGRMALNNDQSDVAPIGYSQAGYSAPVEYSRSTRFPGWLDDRIGTSPGERARSSCHRADCREGLYYVSQHREDEGAMPRRSKGIRLWLEPARRDEKGRVVRRAVFVIRDGATKRSTGFGEGEIEQAQRALAEYQVARYNAPRVRDREPGSTKIADVISIYADDVAIKHARPKETAARLERLLDFFGNESLLYINKRTCVAYVRQRRSETSARRELEDLRAAIRYHERVLHSTDARCASRPIPVPRPLANTSRSGKAAMERVAP